MKAGDPVLLTGKLPEVAGVVIETTPLSTRFRMFDGTYARLPNTEVFSSEIRNYSGAVARRVEISVGIAYDQDMDKAILVIRKTLNDISLVLVEPEPSVYVESLGESSVNINIWCWAPFSEWFSVKTLLVQKIKQEFDNNNIEMQTQTEQSK
jgi:small-conductance mechanosensitive channel